MEVKIDSGAARIRCNGHEMASTGSTKAGLVLDWLKQDHGVGRGHGMAIVHIIGMVRS
jgi:Domain of unknown function (DUF4287)